MFARKKACDELDITSARFRAGAYAHYARLREVSPVTRVMLPAGGPVWLVTRYDDAEAWLKDDRLAKDPRQAGATKLPAWLSMLNPLGAFDRNMLDVDPPDHSRLRKLVHRAFTPRRVAELEGRIEELADELLSRALPRGRMELVS